MDWSVTRPRKVKSWNSKLDEDKVKQILARLKIGEEDAAIAKDFKVSHQTIYLIKRNKIWKQVSRGE